MEFTLLTQEYELNKCPAMIYASAITSDNRNIYPQLFVI